VFLYLILKNYNLSCKLALAPLESTPKWHLDRFSCLHRAHDCDRQTDRHITLLHL